MGSDLRHALRSLRKSPGFTTIAVLCLDLLFSAAPYARDRHTHVARRRTRVGAVTVLRDCLLLVALGVAAGVPASFWLTPSSPGTPQPAEPVERVAAAMLRSRLGTAMPRTSIRFRALAIDYDDTLATNGTAGSAVLDGLRRLKDSGRRLLLVTGRELDDLRKVGPDLRIFDRVVAENGAILYRPDSGEEAILSEAPGTGFVDLLRRKGVAPLSVGRVIVATREPQEVRVLDAIRELGLELEIIFNKGAVMVLPSGVNKASGLVHALRELKVPPQQVVAIGDAENDHAFLGACGYGIAVANAIQSLKDRADLVTAASAGAGVLEVVEQLLSPHRAYPDVPRNR